MNQYFYAEYNSGTRKYVKTNYKNCEVITLSPFGNKIQKFPRPYPLETEDLMVKTSKVIYASALSEVEKQHV